MRTQGGALLLLVTIAAVGVTASGGVSAQSADGGPPPSCSSDVGARVFVANADSGPVAAYAATSTAAATPALLVQNPNLTGTTWDPWGVAFDAQGSLYVQSYLSDATSFVFAVGGRGASLTRVFHGDGPDTRSIAVDANGFEYIATSQQASTLDVLAPGASGQVTPLRSIQSDEAIFHPWPSLLTTDGDNNLVAGIARTSGNAIEVFQGGASGSSTPLRTIAGPTTGLGTCGASCDEVAVAFSPFADGYYAAVSSTSGSHVSLFAHDASGDAAPLLTIAGPSTGLSGQVITGVAVSPCTGDVYVMVKGGQFAAGQIQVFDRTAQGDAAPKRTFTDQANAFTDAQGIAIGVRPIAPPVPAMPAWALSAFAVGLLALASRLRIRAG